MKTKPPTPTTQSPVWPALLVLVLAASLTAADTNPPPPRPAVAVLRWRPEEPSVLAAEDRHWLGTFTGLVAEELRQVAALRVIPEEAVSRAAAREKFGEANLADAARPAAGCAGDALGYAGVS